MSVKGWRKAGGFVLLVVLSAFTNFVVTWEIVALYATLCGANAAVKYIAERTG